MPAYEIIESASSLNIVFPSNLDLVADVVDDALAFVLKHVEGIEQFTFKLALFESLNNAVKHGARQDPNLKIKLRIEMTPACVDITIADSGAGFDWRKAMKEEEEPAAADKPSGRGIFLLKSYNCHPVYNEQGNVLSLRIDLV